MGIILGLLAAVFWGLAGLFGRSVARTAGPLQGMLYARTVSLILLLTYFALPMVSLPDFSGVSLTTWLLAILVGALNVGATFLLFTALRLGNASIVVPISNSSAAITVMLSLMSGERLSAIAAMGVFVAIFGVVLTASRPASTDVQLNREQTLAIGYSLIAACGFGTSFWLLGFFVTAELGSVVPILISRVNTLVILGGITMITRDYSRLALPKMNAAWVIVAQGVFGTLGFVTNNNAYRFGSVGIVTLLASTSSAITVMLAAWIFGERLTQRQWVGVGILVLGIVMVSY